MRSGVDDNAIRDQILGIWTERADQYSDLRWANLRMGTYAARAHKKIEMITLGG